MGWKFFLDNQGWLGASHLHVVYTGYDRTRKLLAPATLVEAPLIIEKGGVPPFLGQTLEQKEDGLGDVDQFLQAALDCAWDAGMRPTGFKDHTTELAAVRFHLEDMRTLALKPKG